MKNARINGIELEYEITGSGEPLLLIDPVLADGFVPLLAQRDLADRYRLVTYHKRGWVGSSRTPGPVTVAQHAADAAALLEHLDIPRAHVGGHSSGAAVALELALDRPERVHSLVLLEPSLLSVPAAQAFFAKAGPALEAHAAGRHEEALAIFMSAASGLDWERCRTLLEERVPGMIAQSIRDADTFFAVEIPGLTQWSFEARQAATIAQPVLSVLGSDTEALWVEVDDMLRSSIPSIEACKIEGVGHLLHLQRPEPVAREIAAFLGRHPMSRNRGQIVNPNQALWEKGDFTRIAQSMRESGEALVRELGVTRGLRILDLGCGDGTTALPEARLGADVLGVDIARNLVDAGNKRATEAGLTNCKFQEGDASNLHQLKDESFDLVVSIFGAMFAPKPFDVAKEMVRVTRRGGRIVMGNWIPNDPTLVAQILKISSSYSPPPPEGFVSPMTWGMENNVIERFGSAGIPKDKISFVRDTYTFNFSGTPVEFLDAFRKYYGPTMNAFDAAEKNGRADELRRELESLFTSQNKSPSSTSIPATFLRVTVLR
ncbi:MAG TPA: alpha/beta fold hydrolase [Polyangiaceae bacterium]